MEISDGEWVSYSVPSEGYLCVGRRDREDRGSVAGSWRDAGFAQGGPVGEFPSFVRTDPQTQETETVVTDGAGRPGSYILTSPDGAILERSQGDGVAIFVRLWGVWAVLEWVADSNGRCPVRMRRISNILRPLKK